jgi:hypothetical protein
LVGEWVGVGPRGLCWSWCGERGENLAFMV